jgi:hypothetical protein
MPLSPNGVGVNYMEQMKNVTMSYIIIYITIHFIGKTYEG